MQKHAVAPAMIRQIGSTQTRPTSTVWTQRVVATTVPAPAYVLEDAEA